MKTNLPCLSLACIATLIGQSASAQPAADATPRTQLPGAHTVIPTTPDDGGLPPARPAAVPAPGHGDRLVDRARRAIRSHASVKARLRQRAQLFDCQLFGNGNYLQQGRGDEMRVRLELKIQVADQLSSMCQITDGRYLWTEHQQRNRTRLHRVHVKQVRTAAMAMGTEASPSADLLAMGGLPALLASLATNFQFADPTEGKLGNLPVYRLRGRWQPAQLDRLLSGGDDDRANANRSADKDTWPAHVPHAVLLQLGRDDLFPHVIEYGRDSSREAGQGGGAGGTQCPLVRMELYEVQIGAAIDPREFVYRPGNVKPVDDTRQYLSRLRRSE